MPAELLLQSDYRSHNSLNYSLIKLVDHTPWELTQERGFESKAMIMGTGVDMLLTTPDEWDKKFYVFEFNLPSQTTKFGKLVKMVYDSQDYSDEFIAVAYEALEMKQIKLEKVIEDFQPYKDLLILKREEQEKGKYVITNEENIKINRAVYDLQTHPFTAKYFTPAKGIEILYQTPIVYEHEIYEPEWQNPNGEVIGKRTNIQLKALIDLIYIDHNNKVIEPKDIKTTSVIDSFYKSILDYRYDIQNVIYRKAILEYFEALYPGYIVEKFEFICADFSQPGKVRKFMLNDEFNTRCDTAFNDWVTKSGRKMKGVNTLIKNYLWHLETGNYDYTKEIYDNNGTIFLEL